MILQKRILLEINKIGGVDFFKKEMEITKYSECPKNWHVFDIWIIYADCLEMNINLETERDVILLKNDIIGYIKYFKSVLTRRTCLCVKTCIDIMEYNLNYIKNLRLLAS